MDGDGILYCITEEGESSESVQREFFDREEYEKWVAETMPEWERIDVVYHSMTKEEIEGIRLRYIEDMEEHRIHQKWVEFTDVELTAEQIRCGLLTSWLGSR